MQGFCWVFLNFNSVTRRLTRLERSRIASIEQIHPHFVLRSWKFIILRNIIIQALGNMYTWRIIMMVPTHSSFPRRKVSTRRGFFRIPLTISLHILPKQEHDRHTSSHLIHCTHRIRHEQTWRRDMTARKMKTSSRRRSRSSSSSTSTSSSSSRAEVDEMMRSLMKRTAKEQTQKSRASALRVDVNLANSTAMISSVPKVISSSRTSGRRRRICADPPLSIVDFTSSSFETKISLNSTKISPNSTKINRDEHSNSSTLSKKLRTIRELHCARRKGTVLLCMKQSTGDYVVLKRVNKRVSGPFGRERVFLDVYVLM